MKTRNAKTTKIAITTAQFEVAMTQYAEAERKEAEINKCIEEAVNEAMEQYADQLRCLAQGRNEAFETARAYCINNKEELFSKRRRIGTIDAIAGFRLGTPRLKTTRGSNWNKVAAGLKNKLPDYIRIVEEPARDLLLADRQKEHVAPLLIEIGIEVVQDEIFYIETKKAA